MSFSPSPFTALADMLAYARPANSRAEGSFIRAHIEPLGVRRDKAGNCIKHIPGAAVLWSCHTDTVHKRDGRQSVDIINGIARLSPGSKSSCLGADDTAGVWLMSEMILAGVPGLYIFHAAEEIGGIGSSYIARHTPKLLDGIDCAIALDRKGRNSVITHQGARCCSDTFARSLSRALGMGFKPDDAGLFTDTANYTDLVGECSNLSVGYDGAHSDKETLDINFLVKLRDKLVSLDTDALDIARMPGDPDEEDIPFYTSGGSAGAGWTEMERLVCDHPDIAADFLDQAGIGVEEFKRALRYIGRAP